MNQETRMDYAIVAQVAMDWAMDESTADRLEHPLKDCAQAIRDLLEETAYLGEELVAEAARTAEEKLRVDQITEQHRMQCNIRKEVEDENQQLRGQYDAAASVVAELQAQLSAIGAGGVKQLRNRECLQQITERACTEELRALEGKSFRVEIYERAANLIERQRAQISEMSALQATPPAQDQDAPAAAWMTPEGDRVVTEATMTGARKDGGAILSSLRAYSIALVRADAQKDLARRKDAK